MKKLTTHNSQLTTIPQHIAIIMDGNRRWARQRGLRLLAGHRQVANHVLEPLVEHAAHLGIKYLTLWAFSTENWSRDPVEVGGIMRIFRKSLVTFGRKMHEKGIRILTIGDMSKFDQDIQQSVNELLTRTKNNTRITLIFALNYGGRDEITRAVSKLLKSPRLPKESQLTAKIFSQFLDTAGIPDPDIIVRPGGEKRLSGFMLWQCQYSELYFADWYMPEFTPQKLDEILVDFGERQRRFGK